MDSADNVLEQPVSVFSSDGGDTRDGLVAASFEADSFCALEPAAFLNKSEDGPILAEQRETPMTVQFQEDTNKTNENENLEKLLIKSVLPGRSPPDVIIEWQAKDRLDTEVDLLEPAGDVQGSSHEGTLVVSRMQQEAGHVGVLIGQADEKSIAEEISVDVVMHDAGPPLVSETGGDLGEVVPSVELGVKNPLTATIQGAGNGPKITGVQHSNQVVIAGYSWSSLGYQAKNTAALIDEQDNASSNRLSAATTGTAQGDLSEEMSKFLQTASVVGPSPKDFELWMSDSRNGIILEKNILANSGQLMNNSEGEITAPLVEIIMQSGTEDASTVTTVATLEEVLSVPVSQDADDNFIVDLHDINVPELESIPIPTMDEINEEILGTGVVGDTGQELLSTGENANVASMTVVTDSPTTTFAGERLELSNSEQTKMNETFVHSPERNENLGFRVLNVEVLHASEEVEASSEVAALISIQIPEVKVKDSEKCTETIGTAPEETVIHAAVESIQEDMAFKSLEEMAAEQQSAVTFEEMITTVTNDAGMIPSGETVHNAIDPVDTTVVAAREDTDLSNPPAAIEESPIARSESMVSKEEGIGATMDGLVDPEKGLVAMEETTDTTVSITAILQLSGTAVADDDESHGVLIGVDSSVESGGITITEIADNSVTAEDFQVEQQSAWVLSEPLITPPEDVIIAAIGDGAADDIVHLDEPPQSPESLLLVVSEDHIHKRESNDWQTLLDGKTQTRLEPTSGIRISQDPAQSSKAHTEQHTTDDAVVVDMATPLDLQDEQPLLPTLTDMETGTADISAASRVCPPVVIVAPAPANPQPTDLVAENIVALQDSSLRGHQDAVPFIAEAVDFSVEDHVVPMLSGVLTSDAHPVDLPAEDGSSFNPGFEPQTVSVSRPSIHQSSTAIVEPLADVDQDKLTGGYVSDVVTQVTKELGFSLESAVEDNSVPGCEARGMETADAGGLAPVVDMDTDGSRHEHLADCTLDGSTYILVDGLDPVEALERNAKKRAREEKGNAAAEDEEKTLKSAKTSDAEVSLLNDIGSNDVKIGEDVQLDKKRSRDELEAVLGTPDVPVQTKAQKIATVEDNAVLPSHEADTHGEVDGEECGDMEDKEEVQETSTERTGKDARVPRYKKRKIGLFLGYSGAGYQGMQKNPGAITIEGELEEALFRAGAIAESNFGHPQKLDWRRAARTDKGVSAVGQVVSGCFFVDPPGFVERVNSHLPKQIRLYGYKRATAGFNAKKLCDRRKYEYVLPVYAFDPTVHLDRETAVALAAVQRGNSLNQIEIRATEASISGSVVETEASVVTESVIKETVSEEGSAGTLVEPVGEILVSLLKDATNGAIAGIGGKEDNQSSSNGMPIITQQVTIVTDIAQENVVAEDLVRTEEVVLETKKVLVAETGVDLRPEAKEDVDEKTSTAPAEVLVQTNAGTGVSLSPEVKQNVDEKTSTAPVEILVQTKVEIGVDLSTEVKEDVDEKTSTAPVEVLVQTKETLTEQTALTVQETVTDLSLQETKEVLDDKVKRSTYMFDDAELNRLNRILKGFEGHHNFHNFTARTKATDPSANRYIVSFGVENTFVIDGIEFVRCSVVGHSFMLHQIRKMIGLAVAIMRGAAPESILATALRRDTKINVPMAPELGLFLEECYYSAYNRKFKATHEEMTLSSFSAQVNNFKKEFIYPHIGSTEARDSTFAMWLHSLNDRHYPHFVAAREAEKLKSQ